MAKNIVLCCDGTGNEYGDHNSNVVKLYSVLLKDDERQAAFYDPGVGTFSAPEALTRTARFITRALGLAFGLGITRNIEDACRFLMETYDPGDRLFLFGFSRGAYTARAIAAILHKCGLLERRNENLLEYAVRMFKNERRAYIYGGFKRTFARPCPIHFLGLWDTVKSVGWIYDPLTLPFTAFNPSVEIVRHAVSIDERRCFYRQNLWDEDAQGQDVRQVWFAGAHSDVGGSYPERQSSLAQITLQWMIEEAEGAGLLVDRKRCRILIPGEGRPEIESVREGEETYEAYHARPDYRGPIHQSLNGLWWIPEFIPKLYHDPREKFRRKLMIPAGRRRWIPENSWIHESVAMRMQDPSLAYSPPNLPRRYTVCSSPGQKDAPEQGMQ